jgi:hypothetical protein
MLCAGAAGVRNACAQDVAARRQSPVGVRDGLRSRYRAQPGARLAEFGLIEDTNTNRVEAGNRRRVIGVPNKTANVSRASARRVSERRRPM